MKLPQTWAEIGFEVEITGDGSPSLRLLKPTFADAEKGESMHHSGGAAAETELIYGKVIRRCFQAIENPHFMSVGLGLGYVELIVAREALFKQNMNFTLESFESVPELKSLLNAWLKGEILNGEIQTVYDLMAQYVLQESSVSLQEVKVLLLQKLNSDDWIQSGALGPACQLLRPVHALLFDAFSAKTSPELWDEEFLMDLFRRSMAADALVSTYACRMGLKRALQQTAFNIDVREGFQSKRNSTLGHRGIFSQGA